MELSLTSICLFNEYCPNSYLKPGQQNKIKNRMKTLYQQLCQYSLINVKWIHCHHFQGILLIFSHGVMFSLSFDRNYSLISVSQENFILNKLTSKRISSLELNENFILIAYVEPHLACISLEDSFASNKTYGKFKLSSYSSVKQISLEKYINRLAKRNLSVSSIFALIWWNRMPHRHSWMSIPSDEKNILVFRFEDSSVFEIDPINGEILQANFVDKEPCKFGILYKQKSSAYNLTYLLYDAYDLCSTDQTQEARQTNCTTLVRLVFEISIPMEKLCFSAEFTQSQDKILLLCDDESVMMFNIEQNVLYSLHSSMPICFLSSYPLDSIFVTCDQHGQTSFYDLAFNNIQHCTKSKIRTTSSQQNQCNNFNMSVKRLKFLSPNILVTFMVENRRQDSFKPSNQGLLSSLRSTTKNVTNCCFKLTIFSSKISFKRLINEYLYLSKYEEALNILRIINWNCSYEDAYLCLHTLFQHLMKLPSEPDIDNHIESTLATFLIPMTPIDYKIFEKILPYIRQLAIGFFYRLIRSGSLDKAYQLAIELKSPRLFLLLAQLFQFKNMDEMASKSYDQASSLRV